jgi:hypothetical protein
MRLITINPSLDMETLEWVSNDGVYVYSGPLDLCLGGGASSAANANAKSEQEFMQQLQAEQQTQFGNEQVAQNQLQKAWSPIVAGGAYQYGFSTAEDEQLRQNIENAGAQATENTDNAALLREQQASGGANAGPSGATEAINAQVAATGAQSTATNLGKEKELGYQTGRENFLAATGGEAEVANLSSPTSFANSATSAAGASNQAVNLVDTENANSMLNKVIGGAIGAIPGIGGSIAEGMSGGGGLSDVISSVAGGL